jgi:hypothetical protein
MQRRQALATTGAALSAALVGIAASTRRAATEPSEHPWARVRRLSTELSQALAHKDVGGFYAEVYPATDRPRPIAFVATDTMALLQDAIRTHKVAYDRLMRGEEGRCSDRRLAALIKAEDIAFRALLALPCPSLSAVQLKAYYIERARPAMPENSLSAVEASALLRSLYQYEAAR